MFKMFSGLENLLVNDVEIKEDIFAKKTKQASNASNSGEAKALTAEDVVYFKECECAVCSSVFMNSTVKLRTAKYVGSDTDLRMFYEPIDPMYYDVILCSHCGYAAVSRNFKKVTAKQMELIREKVSVNFKPMQYPLILDTDQAIERYKVALLNAVVKEGKEGEKAYLCLKLAWLYRDKKDAVSEKGFTINAVRGFNAAYQNETFPICGLEEFTLMYILADLSRRLGDKETCLRYLGSLITNKSVNSKLREKALALKDLVKS